MESTEVRLLTPARERTAANRRSERTLASATSRQVVYEAERVILA
jgi:hypothetical protein